MDIRVEALGLGIRVKCLDVGHEVELEIMVKNHSVDIRSKGQSVGH